MLTTGQTHEKPHRAESRRGGVVCGILLSVLQVVGLDLRNKSGGESGQLGNLPDVSVLLPPTAYGGDVLPAVARLDRGTASLGSIGAGGCGLCFGLHGASKAPQLLCCFVFHFCIGWRLFALVCFESCDQSLLASKWDDGDPAVRKADLPAGDSDGLDLVLTIIPKSPKLRGAGAGNFSANLVLLDLGKSAVNLEGEHWSGVGHGALRLVDTHTIPNRLGYARKISNYFHSPIPGLPLNASVEARQ